MTIDELLLTDFTENELLTLIPELQIIKDFKNGKVLKHTILAIKNAPLNVEIRLALLFHDIGKPKVHIIKNGEDKYPQHQVVSETMARQLLNKYPLKNNTDLELVYVLIREHMNKREKTSTDKATTRLYNRLGEKAFNKLLEVFLADIKGYENYSTVSFEKVQNRIIEWRNKDRTIFKPSYYYAINGNDLLSLGYSGKTIGKILKYVRDTVDKDLTLNNKEILMKLIKGRDFE